MVANKVVFVALLAFAFIIGIVDYLFIYSIKIMKLVFPGWTTH